MRSLSELRAAAFAGEPLTAEEVARLRAYETLADRMLDGIRQTLPPEDQKRAPTGDEVESFLADTLVSMDALGVVAAEDPRVVEPLERMKELVILVRLQADALAKGTGQTRRTGHENRAKQQLAAAAKREKAATELAAVEAKQTATPALTDPAAARLVLQTDPSWLAGTDAERERKVAALVRRIQRAKKDGH
jgi:hypothetical protein